jgi:hypothetical protein
LNPESTSADLVDEVLASIQYEPATRRRAVSAKRVKVVDPTMRKVCITIPAIFAEKLEAVASNAGMSVGRFVESKISRVVDERAARLMARWQASFEAPAPPAELTNSADSAA